MLVKGGQVCNDADFVAARVNHWSSSYANLGPLVNLNMDG